MIDIYNSENSKLLQGKDIRDRLPNPKDLIFDYDDVLARGLYHIDKSLGEKETTDAMKAFSKAIFKTGFYFCIFLDRDYRNTSILEIGNKLKQLSKNNDFLEKVVGFYEKALIYRITGSFITEFNKLRDNFIILLFLLFEEGTLHRRMNSQELTKYLADIFNGFSNIIQRLNSK
ncbi:hypothetical protein LCGC14_1529550 [marine sediment metagenome]|uniref:Uncharacterized protein n=1 Tax=marine sediment metagenome TaxID=412755 RepID=A0A0F9IW73_9ZZZZ